MVFYTIFFHLGYILASSSVHAGFIFLVLASLPAVNSVAAPNLSRSTCGEEAELSRTTREEDSVCVVLKLPYTSGGLYRKNFRVFTILLF